MLLLRTSAALLLASILPSMVTACDWNAPATDKAGTYTCGQRIDWLKSPNGGSLSDADARRKVADEFPDICGSCTGGGSGGGGTSCASVWNAPATDKAGTYTCGARITWLQSSAGMSDGQAKNMVAKEFPSICGACATSGGGGGGGGGSSGALSVVTQNLFWGRLFDQLGGGDFFRVFKSKGPSDIFLFQECKNVNHIRNGLGFPGMETIQGSFELAIMYNGNRFRLLNKGLDVVGEDRADEYWGRRSVLWARLQDKSSGQVCLVASHHGPLPINTGGKDGPSATASRIAEVLDTRRQNGDKVIIGGDFNADVGSETIRVLKQKGYMFHGSDWVDQILTRGMGASSSTEIIRGSGSDHRGVKNVWSNARLRRNLEQA